MILNSTALTRSHIQVSYHLRFTSVPRNAPIPEKSELNPNSDLDWHTFSLFPLFQLPGPREQHDTGGGTPGENLNTFHAPFSVSPFFRQARGTIQGALKIWNLWKRQKYMLESLKFLSKSSETMSNRSFFRLWLMKSTYVPRPLDWEPSFQAVFPWQPWCIFGMLFSFGTVSTRIFWRASVSCKRHQMPLWCLICPELKIREGPH